MYEELNGKISVILDGGNSLIGLESTVIDLTKQKTKILDMVGINKKKKSILSFLFVITKKNNKKNLFLRGLSNLIINLTHH